MTNNKLSELLKTQKSLTEWLEDIKHSDTALIRKEDNEKRERLRVLNEVIDLPYDKPTQFQATELRDYSTNFANFLEEHGSELCALRIIPIKDGLPKLRMRGKTISGAYDWFKEQDINPDDYRADFVPHISDSTWATIFIVNKHGIQGEIIYGGHHQLTQGFHDDSTPFVFRYDFADWYIEPSNDEVKTYLKRLVDFIHISDKGRQENLKDKLNAEFVNDYLVGYFETTDSSAGTWYIDYNKSLGKMYSDTIIRTTKSSQNSLVSGQTGSPGQASGKVFLVEPENINIDFPEGAVLVCKVTTPDYVPLMQKSCAIVTDQGGILSHAAIVARELGKPCIVGTGSATSKLSNDEEVCVDADEGIVKPVL